MTLRYRGFIVEVELLDRLEETQDNLMMLCQVIEVAPIEDSLTLQDIDKKATELLVLKRLIKQVYGSIK